MTLIVTTISSLGILQASDSNLTYVTPAGLTMGGSGKKVFSLGFCPGALALAGTYSLNGVAMDTWMERAIGEYGSSSSATLEGFARDLAARLTTEGEAGKTSLLLHIAGYAKDAAGTHPELWFVRNFDGIDGITGEYTGRSDTFAASEDFWTRDYPADCELGDVSSPSYFRRYFNGLPDGRISYLDLFETLQAFLHRVWDEPAWEFREPQDISELASFMRLELNVMGTLFEISNYSAPLIGGEAQIEIIDRPSDAVPFVASRSPQVALNLPEAHISRRIL
jgi:hypothetical protein